MKAIWGRDARYSTIVGVIACTLWGSALAVTFSHPGTLAELAERIYDRDKSNWFNSQSLIGNGNLTSLLDSITQRLAKRRVDKWTDYRSLVALVCNGKEPDADRIAMVSADNNRTLEQLRHDVQLLAKRHKLRADMDAAPPLESERQKVE